MDHDGLAGHILPSVPVWIGEDAHDIWTAANRYVRNGSVLADPRFMAHRKALDIGPFRVTPYLVDHSAFDAYALLVEGDGKRMLCSSDFRGHGRKARLSERMIADPPASIDVLLMEGTTIGRAEAWEGFATENDLEGECVRAFEETPQT